MGSRWYRKLGRKLTVPALLVVTAAVQLLTMPRFSSPGDNMVALDEAIHLVETGELGFSYDDPARPRQVRGQYYFENDARRRAYSKYGFGYTLVYLPPLLIEHAIQGRLVAESESFCLVLNVYNVLFAMGFVWFLYRLAARFDRGRLLPAAFSLAVVYGSYVWYYLRAPTFEVYQLFFFAACLSSAFSFARFARHRVTSRRAGLNLLVASVSAGFLVLFRPTFLSLLPVLVFLVASAGAPGRGWIARVAENYRARKIMLLAYGAAPLLLCLGVWLTVNAVRTGSPFDSGYGQWIGRDGLRANRFTLSVLPRSLFAVLLQPGNANALLHQPVLLFALLGWPAFAARFRREAILLGATVLASAGPLFVVSNWCGEWCYGPRYFVHSLVAASLPATFFWRSIPRFGAVRRVAAATLSVAILAASFLLQIRMNAFHHFAYQYAVFSVRSGPDADAYLEGPRFRPVLVGGLDAFVTRGERFEAIDSALDALAEPVRSGAREEARRQLAPLVEPNWYLAAPRAVGL